MLFDVERCSPSGSSGSQPEQEERKISAALADLIDPYQDGVHSLDEYRTLVSIGAAAWNLAILPDNERHRSLSDAIQSLDVPDPTSFRRLVSEMMQRKESLFPNDRRLIVSYDVSTTPSGYYLTVAAEHAV